MIYQSNIGVNLLRPPTSLSDSELNEAVNKYKALVASPLGMQANSYDVGTKAAYASRLQDLQNELQTRQASSIANQRQGQVQQIYDQALAGAPSAFNQQDYITEQNKYATAEQGNVQQAYQNQLQGALQGIQQNYIPQKQGLVEDLASQGLLNQGNSRYSLNALEAQKARDIANTYSQLGAAQGGAMANIQQGLAGNLAAGRQYAAGLGQQERELQLNKANQLASYLQGGGQFGQNFGLASNQFQYGVGQNNFNNQLGLYGLNQADRLGQLQARAQRPTGLQQFGQVASGLGGLLGGIGGLATGLRGLKSPSTVPVQGPF